MAIISAYYKPDHKITVTKPKCILKKYKNNEKNIVVLDYKNLYIMTLIVTWK